MLPTRVLLVKSFPSLDEPLPRGNNPRILDLLINTRARLEAARNEHLFETLPVVCNLGLRRLTISLNCVLDKLKASVDPMCYIVSVERRCCVTELDVRSWFPEFDEVDGIEPVELI